MLFFAGTLLPALGFIDYFTMRYTYVADHFQYLASIGPITLFVAVATKLSAAWMNQSSMGAGRYLSQIILSLPLILYCILVWNQCHIYKNTITLWSDTLSKNPNAWIAHNNLGAEFVQRGDYEKAVFHLRQTIQIKSDYIAPYINLGIVNMRLKQYEEAIQYFISALKTTQMILMRTITLLRFT